MQKYKALVTDIDGTLIPNQFDGKLSQKTIDAFAKIKDTMHIAVATSRHPQDIFHLTSALNLTGPSIVYGGAQIINVATKEVLWEQPLDIEEAKEMIDILRAMEIPFVVNDNGKKNHIQKTTKYLPDKPLSVWVYGQEADIIDTFHKIIKHLRKSDFHTIPSWKNGKMDFLVTHIKATKQHALYELTKLLQIQPKDLIAIGDGPNDLPLLMSAGLKVAMGNAVDDLKAIADYVAPSVEDDGVADVIEKFILQEE